MRPVYIYALTDPLTGVVRYIGKSVCPARRLYLHVLRSEAKQTHKDCWISNLRSKNSAPVLTVLDEVPSSQQNFFERAYIKAYRESGADLTNHTDGGDGGATTLGRKRPRHECERIRERLVGVPKSPSHRAALSAALKGRPLPANKLRRGGRKHGFRHSQETRNKISATRKLKAATNVL